MTRPEHGRNLYSRLRGASLDPTVLAAAATVLLLAIGQLVSPGFASVPQIVNMLTVAAFLGIVAAGQTLVVVGGGSGIDLSVGKVVTLGAIVGGAVMNGNDARIVVALLIVVVVTFAVGLVNGTGIAYLGIPPLVMTLGMSIVVAAISQFITGGVPVEGAPDALTSLVVGRVAGIPGILVWWALLAVMVVFTLRNTSYGMRLYAMGANTRAAFLSGVHVRPTRAITYGLCAATAGVAGFLYLGYVGSVYNVTLGDKYMLSSVVAVVIGGVSLAGGTGGYVGVVVGAVLLQVLESVLITVNIDQWGRNIIFGVVLLLLLLAYGREKRLRQ